MREEKPVPVYLMKRLWRANYVLLTAAMAEPENHVFIEEVKEIREAIKEVLGTEVMG